MAIENQNYDPAAKASGEWVTDDIKNANVTGAKIATTIGYFSVATQLTGTNTGEFNVFGSSGLGVASSIVGFAASAVDRTISAVNVSLVSGQSSVGTVVLDDQLGTGSTAGPDAALESAAIAAGTKLFLERTTDSIVQVTLTFEID